VLAYVTARAIQQRLDDVVGPENWSNEFSTGPDGGVLCGISIRVDDAEWVTKYDGAPNTDIESVKGGLSGATKRAAVQWGIGRYLYHLDTGWANINDKGMMRDKVKGPDGKYVWFKWDPPALPRWALPGGSGQPDKSQPSPASGAAAHRPPPPDAAAPRGGGSPPKAKTDTSIFATEKQLERIRELAEHEALSDQQRKSAHAALQRTDLTKKVAGAWIGKAKKAVEEWEKQNDPGEPPDTRPPWERAADNDGVPPPIDEDDLPF
jgi:hypothetical protein